MPKESCTAIATDQGIRGDCQLDKIAQYIEESHPELEGDESLEEQVRFIRAYSCGTCALHNPYSAVEVGEQCDFEIEYDSYR